MHEKGTHGNETREIREIRGELNCYNEIIQILSFIHWDFGHQGNSTGRKNIL